MSTSNAKSAPRTTRAQRLRMEAATKKMAQASLEGGQGPCLIDQLPDEIIQLIFSQLDDANTLALCSMVCTRWYIIATVDELWHPLILNLHRKVKNLKVKPSIEVGGQKNEYARLLRTVRGRKVSTAVKGFIQPDMYGPLPRVLSAASKVYATCRVSWSLLIVDALTGSETRISCNEVNVTESSVLLLSQLDQDSEVSQPKDLSKVTVHVEAKSPLFTEYGQRVTIATFLLSSLQKSDITTPNAKFDLRISPPTPPPNTTVLSRGVIAHGLLVALWQDTQVSTLLTTLSIPALLPEVVNAMKGSSMPKIPKHQPVLDDIDTKHGLNDYIVRARLRSTKSEFLAAEGKMDAVVRDGFAIFSLEFPAPQRKVALRILGKDSLTFSNELAPELCVLDVQVINDHGEHLLATSVITPSTAVTVLPGTNVELDLQTHPETSTESFDQVEHPPHLDIYVPLQIINTWYCTKYK